MIVKFFLLILPRLKIFPHAWYYTITCSISRVTNNTVVPVT